MKKFLNNDSGQLVLITCVSIAAALVLIAMYEYSTLGTGEKSINREDMNSYYFYKNIKNRYTEIYNDNSTGIFLNRNNPKNLTYFEKEMKEFALLHGYSVDFACNGRKPKIIFMDRDIKIEEELDEGGLCT